MEMSAYVWFGFGAVLVIMAVISYIMDSSRGKGVPVTAVVKKVATRDNYDHGYATYLERRLTYAFTYNGEKIEKEEKSGNMFEEGDEVQILYNPKEDMIYHEGDTHFNPTILAAMMLGGLVCFYGGFFYEVNQPSIALVAAVALIIFAAMQLVSLKNSMKDSQKVACKTVAIFRAEHKKRGTSYYPVYELEYNGRKRRVIRSYEGSSDKAQIGKVEELHIDPLTSDFAEGKKGLYELLISISLTLVVACLLGALYLTINPF